MKKIISLSTYLLLSVLCFAQNTESVTFKVEDFNTNKIVVGAQISIKEAGWATKSTGADGKVLFEKMSMGEIHYTVLKDGYQRLDGAVNVTTKGDDNNFLLSLNKIPKPNEDKILITGEVNDTDGRDVEGALVEAKIANIIRTVQSDESGNYSLELALNGNPGGTKIFMEIKTKSGCKTKDAFDLPREVVVVKDFKLNCNSIEAEEVIKPKVQKVLLPIATQTLDGVKINIMKFEKVSSILTVHFTLENVVTNEQIKSYYFYSDRCELQSQDGVTFSGTRCEIGKKEVGWVNLINGNTVNGIIEFNIGSEDISKAQLLTISYGNNYAKFINIKVK